MSFKYSAHTLKKIETLFKEGDYIVRYEKGSFNSGYCILEDKKVVVINKFYDTEARINCLVEILQTLEISEEKIDNKFLHFLHELKDQKTAL